MTMQLFREVRASFAGLRLTLFRDLVHTHAMSSACPNRLCESRLPGRFLLR